jgi:hypothetical protein
VRNTTTQLVMDHSGHCAGNSRLHGRVGTKSSCRELILEEISRFSRYNNDVSR